MNAYLATPTNPNTCSGAHCRPCQGLEGQIDGERTEPHPKPWGYDLWDHLYTEHGLILMESELQEVVRLARAIP